MKKLMVFGISLFVLILLVSLVSGVRVNEVELNPEGNDSGYEWIELYSEVEINLTGWTLVNNDGDVINLTQVFQDYLIIDFSGQWLDNVNESVILKNSSGDIIYETIILADSNNNDKTWQYCDGDWNFIDSTKESENSCEGPPVNDSSPSQTASVDLELDWNEEDIVNGKEFELDVDVYNLESKDYDMRVYITFKNNTLISEIYHEEDEKWRSGSNYVVGVFSGSGNKSETFSLRIKEKYEHFYGDVKIVAKIRETDTRSVKDSVTENMELLEEDAGGDDDEREEEDDEDEEEDNSAAMTGGVIRLGERKEDNEENKKGVIYESGSEKVKKYAIYGLNLILIVILILLARKKI